MDDINVQYINILMLMTLTISLISTFIFLSVRKFYVGRCQSIFLICLYVTFIITAISINYLISNNLSNIENFNPCS